MSKARTSIRDVAQESGVSLTTVSLVLNKNDERISDATRRRVLEAMEKLSYTPSRLARGLPNRRANTLAVLVPGLKHALADVYFGEVISGIYDAAADAGFRILLEVARPQYVKRREYMTLLDDCSVDGVLFIGATEEHTWLAEFDGSGKPVMIVNNYFQRWDLHHVVCDYTGAGRMAAEYLVGLGHARIGHISGPSDMVATSAELSRSFAERLRELGVELSERDTARGQYLVESGTAACDELLERSSDLSAIFCANDKMAMGAYQSLRARGLQPGREVSVMGCDDIPTSALADPPLTTIRLNFAEVGAESCRQLLRMIQEKDLERTVTARIPVELIERGSCSPAAAAARSSARA